MDYIDSEDHENYINSEDHENCIDCAYLDIFLYMKSQRRRATQEHTEKYPVETAQEITHMH